MPAKPAKQKTIIILVIVMTLILGGVGVYIAINIFNARQITPEESNAATCCMCNLTYTEEDEEITSISLGGVTDGSAAACELVNPFSTGGETKTECTGIETESGMWEADSETVGCEGCMGYYSEPLIPPTPPQGDVTFKSYFATASEYVSAQMEFLHPDEDQTPDPIEIDLTQESEDFRVLTDSSIDGKVYEITYKTTWENVISKDVPGTYRVNFTATNTAGQTAESGYCSAEYTVEEEQGSYCNNLDIVQDEGTDESQVQLTASASTPEDAEVSYNWRLDLNCNGEIEPDGSNPENAETFTTTTPTVTKTFTFGSAESCSAEVVVQAGDRTLSERSEGSCSGEVTLAQATAVCGNGECEEGEECDSGLTCPGGNSLPAGTSCSDECIVVTEQTEEEPTPSQTPEEQPEETDQQTPSPNFEITVSSSQDCVERVDPRNQTEFTINVTNNGGEGTINAISDSLPQGFIYDQGSSSVNNTANPTDTGVVVETTGDSQLVTWNNGGAGWVMQQSDTLQINFTATVGPNAITGDQTNRVTLTPSDENPIPAENTLRVAQLCSQPDTGIFDNNITIILIGTAFLILASIIYYTGFGSDRLALLISTTGTNVNNAKKDLKLLITKPQKYMEKKIERTAQNKIQNHINESKDEEKGQ